MHSSVLVSFLDFFTGFKSSSICDKVLSQRNWFCLLTALLTKCVNLSPLQVTHTKHEQLKQTDRLKGIVQPYLNLTKPHQHSSDKVNYLTFSC